MSFKCCSVDELNMAMSSKYTQQILPTRSPNTRSIVRWNVAGAFFNPNGILVNRYWPPCVINAVLSLSSGAIGIW